VRTTIERHEVRLLGESQPGKGSPFEFNVDQAID
jgi:hypothetical protein